MPFRLVVIDGEARICAVSKPPPPPVSPPQSRTVPRRGLSRIESAMYIGVSPSKFDEMVADGRMPKPVRIDGRKVWDVRALDMAFDALSEVVDKTWDDFE